MRLLATLCLLGALSGLALKANAPLAGKRVVRIEFLPADQPIPLEEVLDLIPLKTGTLLEERQVRESIVRLFATGRFRDIEVFGEPSGEEGVIVRFATEPTYFVGSVQVTGASAPPSEPQAVIATKLRLGQPYSEEDLQPAIDGIAALLRDNGLYSHEIDHQIRFERHTFQVHFLFQVTAGKRASFTAPRFTGSPGFPPESLAGATGWRSILGWRKVTQERLQRGLERLRNWYEKRDHLLADVSLLEVEYEPATNRVRPSVSVEAGPRVRFSARGAKISRGTLRRLVPVFEERSVDRDLLEEGARNIAEHFQSRGYFDAQVTFGRSDLEQGEQLIEYVIEPGQRSKLERIVIEGNRYFREETIRERLAMTPASFQFRYGRFSQSVLDRDAAAIRELYQTNGFEDIRVAGDVRALEDGGREVTLRITEGPQYRVRNLELAGVPEEDEEDIRYLLSSIEGQPFSTSNVAIDRDLVLARYFDLGYPEALFEWTATPVEGAPRFDLRFALTLGERRVVREVLVSGLDETRPEVVERRVVLHPGDPLSLSRMVDIQRRLYALGIFSKVDMAIQNPDGDEELKSVQYDLEESRRYSLTGGVGAEFGRFGGRGSQAPAGATTFAPRVSFNITRLNFRGRAHTVSLKTQASTLQRRGLFTYLAPSFQNREKLTLSFTTLADDSRDIRTFTARRYEGSVQLAQNVSRIYTALYRFSYRVVKVSDLQISPLLIPQVSQAARIGILSGTLIQDRRDDPTNATRGLYSTVDLGVAARAFGSENGFLRLVATNSTYHRLTPKIVFARTTTFGWLPAFGQIRFEETGELFPNVPLAERLFAGGSSSHRGFPQNQAGPRDPATGFPLGGTALLANGLELRFPLLGENIGGVLFHDAGNVFSRLSDISFRSHQRDLRDFSYLVHALGFGVRYNTPIGPVRLDVAYGLNSPRFFVSPPGDPQGCVSPELGCPTDRIRAFQFHFSLGQAF